MDIFKVFLRLIDDVHCTVCSHGAVLKSLKGHGSFFLEPTFPRWSRQNGPNDSSNHDEGQGEKRAQNIPSPSLRWRSAFMSCLLGMGGRSIGGGAEGIDLDLIFT